MSKFDKKDSRAGIVLSLPAFLWMMMWVIIPIIFAFIISFTNYNLLSMNTKFVGFDNYKNIINDPLFWTAIKNTLKFSCIVVPFQIVLGLFLAYVANMGSKFKGVLRTIYYLPGITSGVTIATIFLFLFNKYGIVNQVLSEILSWFGMTFEMISWISDPQFALPLIMIMAIWAGLGFNMLIFLAAFQEVPQSVYEAAAIDGASEVKKFFYITLPMIKNQIYFALTIGIIGSLQVFELAFVASGGSSGSPNNTTLTIIMYIYDKAFTSNQMGYASAASFILFILILILTVLQKLIFEKKGKKS